MTFLLYLLQVYMNNNKCSFFTISNIYCGMANEKLHTTLKISINDFIGGKIVIDLGKPKLREFLV